MCDGECRVEGMRGGLYRFSSSIVASWYDNP